MIIIMMHGLNGICLHVKLSLQKGMFTCIKLYTMVAVYLSESDREK